MTRGDSGDDEELVRRLSQAMGSDPGAFDPDRQPPPERLARVRSAASQLAERPSASAPATSRRALIVGTAAAATAGVAGFGVRGLVGPDEPPTETLTLAGPAADSVVDARMINHAWGVELLIDLQRLPEEGLYQVGYLSSSDTLLAAGSLLSVPEVVMRCRFNAGIPRDQLRAVLITGPSGEELLRADL